MTVTSSRTTSPRMARTSCQFHAAKPGGDAGHGDGVDVVLGSVVDHALECSSDRVGGGIGSPCSLGAEVEDYPVVGSPDEQVSGVELATRHSWR